MTNQTFAPWVEPIAEQLRASRTEIVRTAHQLLDPLWTLPSRMKGWTFKDLLAHLASGDWVCQMILRAALDNEPFDMAALNDVDGQNERHRQERQDRSVRELIAEVQAEGEETQELLARLTDADENRTQKDAPMSLGEYLRGFPNHDREHLEELTRALDSIMI